MKLAENAKISPEKLMKFLAEHEGTVFSPNGILRVAGKDQDPILAARSALEEIRN